MNILLKLKKLFDSELIYSFRKNQVAETKPLFCGRRSRVIFKLLFNSLTLSSWDTDFEASSNAQFTFNFDFSFMCFCNMFADTKSQPATPFIA